MRPSNGFTLIEMLVTMTLLSAIIMVGSSAFALFSQRWDRQLDDFDDTLRYARDLAIVQRVLTSLIPYVVFSEDREPLIYFEGNRNGFVTVASQSAYVESTYVVARFSVVQDDKLRYEVLYEEWAMEEEILRSPTQNIEFNAPLVLFSGVESPIFEYFGHDSLQAKSGVGAFGLPSLPRWMPSFNALDIGFSPEKVRLSFSTSDGYQEIFSSVAEMSPGLLSRYQQNIIDDTMAENTTMLSYD